ncbi:Uncharacterised protein [Vibrio cholerae]|nr:Uncharacterised protein [Vibrio cholerae]
MFSRFLETLLQDKVRIVLSVDSHLEYPQNQVQRSLTLPQGE